ncbi:hypothetical protein GcC1_053016 [Golovinomyces cichoracearum]|uniref:RRM domain-containing protein n=1 Tax=Golovinomyces cichoracearum TaxID=62708 RepID=A0A420IW00_9PEZI|nr:hypothetical protein GcC1_053016 [Golovinomyces cichoracearum]
MGNKNNPPSRQERKAKKRAAEDLIPDIPATEELDRDIDSKEIARSIGIEDNDINHSITKKSSKRKRERTEEEVKKEKLDQNDQGNEEKRDKKKKKREIKKTEKMVKMDEEIVTNLSVKERKEKQIDRTKDKKEKKHSESRSSPNLEIDGGISCKPAEEVIGKKSKKERKAALRAAQGLVRKESKSGSPNIDPHNVAAELKTSDEQKKKKKKDKKDKKTKEPYDDAVHLNQLDDDTNPTVSLTKSSKKQKVSENLPDTATATTSRFIVFVGNLPFTATTASIMAHFSKLKPLAVRHLTRKDDPSKSRGTAFVEFENYDTHKTALKIMHHSTFDDGLSKPRKINVELTAGGGGNTEGRRTKIKHKNDRLNEQRIRRLQEEEKAKREKVLVTETASNFAESAIHPSRRKMIAT